MEYLKGVKGKWVIFLSLCVPLVWTSALYFRESLQVPAPLVTLGARVRNQAKYSSHQDSGSSPINSALDGAADTIASQLNRTSYWSISEDRTAQNVASGEMFIFSKRTVDKGSLLGAEAGKVTSSEGAGDENRTFSMVISNGEMVAEDVKAECNDSTKAEQERHVNALLPPTRDLTGYMSVKNPSNLMFINCSQCAYVSSSGQLRGSKAGQLIDSFPCVIRMNDAPFKGYEQDVGSKTTVRVVAHSAIKGVHAKRASLLKGTGHPKFLLVWGPEASMRSGGKGYAFNAASNLAKDKSLDGMQVFLISQRQIQYADKVFEMETGKSRRDSGSWLSTGWFTMMFARSACNEIHVFGMIPEDYCKKNPNSKVPYHYYQSTGVRECSFYLGSQSAKGNAHRFVTEKSVFTRWSSYDPKMFFKYPEWSSSG